MFKTMEVKWFAVPLALILLLVSVTPVAYFGDDTRSTMAISNPEILDMILAGIPHAPIIIDGDTDFNDTAFSEGWLGNGTSDNPYIIENLDIDLGGGAGHCINITNTQVNFTIRNCNLTGASVDSGAGIYLDNVKNARVVDNLCQHNTHGVLVNVGSENCILINNTCTLNSVSGIQLVESWNITLMRNNCSGNYHGINAIEVVGINGQIREYVLVGNICCNNSYGISLGDINVESVGPRYVTVVNNNCSFNSDDGIRLTSSRNNSISKNNCSRNGGSGILLTEISMYNTFTENNCNQNGQSGIYLSGVAWINYFTHNICSGNNQYGVNIYWFGTESNDFQWNVFDNNLIGNVFDDNHNSVFDYNYWSDYTGTDANEDCIGDTPHTFPGNSDPHPLMFQPTAPTWIETPVDQSIMIDTHFTYDINATAPAPIFWSVNDTAHFTIDNQGVLEFFAFFSLGDYGVQVTVTNIYNRSISAKFNVEVVPFTESTAPGWVITPMNLTLEYCEVVDLQIPALDPSGIDHWNLNDTTHFALSATYYDLGSTARITNNSVLEPATYGLNITVYDSYNNSLSAIFSITIEPPEPDTTPPDWVILHIYQTIEYGEPLQVQVVAWDESGIDHLWLNDTTHFTLDVLGVITNATVLEPGIYRLEVRAHDPYDNYCSAILVVTVLDAPITTTTTTSTTPEGVDPVMTLVLGTGIGGAAVVVIVIVFLRRKS